ncbi:trypsin-like serine protease [Thioclava sp. A2]|uniref:trypsin-like serine peptidase n=1 Tax=Thioclava sp. FCG-A2 TaxID=3080562 RepID=UPI00295565D5|nr:trypsin-like serine protease [Thioclava sp. A2]MDV7270374.1 trypsin-like serine protease [Thioclava sp. A2]
MRSVFALLVFVLALGFGGGARAQSALQTLSTGDATRGWEAVGRLNLGKGSFCTGTLIEPDLVLTAAHCLFDPATGKMFTADQIEFRAGWRNGRAVAYRKVRSAVAHPDYAYQGADRFDRVAWDIALVQLAQPIRLPQLVPIPLSHAPKAGDQVGVVSYSHDRAEAPSLQKRCEVISRNSGVVLMDCNADFGASGSPVFSVASGHPEIVSVVSAKAQFREKDVTLGTLIDHVADLRAALEARNPGDNARQMIRSGGAKFIRAN